jgi:hypothetical protein
MRNVAFFLALLALAGCRSNHPHRDYTSVNKQGMDFLFDTVREGNRMRKQELHRDVQFSERAVEAKRVRKQSVQFAVNSVKAGERDNLQEILDVPKIEHVSWKKRLASMRFGFLDSGD